MTVAAVIGNRIPMSGDSVDIDRIVRTFPLYRDVEGADD